MSIPFSDTVNKSGLIQKIERNCKFNDGDISGNPTLLAQFTADINLAWDMVLSLIFMSDGSWQFDDSNQTDYPIITRNLEANRRDYTFLTDGSGNIILDIYRVMIAGPDGKFIDLTPADQQLRNNTASDTTTFVNGQNITGIPAAYDKTANAIFFDVLPSYSYNNGIKIFINREGTYFTVSDTTKKPGFAGLFHEYLAINPSYEYASINGLANMNALLLKKQNFERAIENYYDRRQKDNRGGMRGNVEFMK